MALFLRTGSSCKNSAIKNEKPAPQQLAKFRRVEGEYEMNQQAVFRNVMDAIKAGDSRGLSNILNANSRNADMVTPFGTWLHVAAAEGQLAVVEMLIDEFGLDIDAGGDVSDSSPINSAALEGHAEVVELLLHRGAKLDISEPNRNPLFGAILGGNVKIAKLLIDRGLDPNIKYTGASMRGTDALTFAKERAAVEFVSLLKQ